MFRLYAYCLFLVASCISTTANAVNNGEIIVLKKERVLLVLKDKKIEREYKISLGKNPDGNKVKQGDNKTPEGKYKIISKNNKSKYYLNLAINYPSKRDIENAKKIGVNPGGDIVLHGLPNKAPNSIHNELMRTDWTNGCIALHNSDIKDLFDLVPVGTSINILP